ncbi:MAG: Hemerythrin cation binding domain protein [Rickettsiales bacterium]|jgi:hemerythrin superfamily protein|nr:Hemerythrin cation binding domain protein [Rickettsiales bacterium]
MDIYGYLIKDHRNVSNLMKEVLNTDNPERREKILEEIQHALLLHAETEQKTFYAALEHKRETEEPIEEAEEEHDEIKQYLSKLSKMPADNEKWMELFGEFKHAVEHHVKEEEERIFEKAKHILSDQEAKRLVTKMEKLKEEMENAPS